MTRRFVVVSIPAFIFLIVMATGTVLLAAPTPGSTEAVVTIDETGAMRINGELFFPIGLYQVPYWEMADVRAHGFNIVDEIQPLTDYLDRTFLDTAKENDLWVRIPLFSGDWWNGDWEEMREGQNWAFFMDYPDHHTSPKHHPAFAMWYVEDEPWHNPPEPYYSNMRAMHDYINLPLVDPNHPDMTCLYDAWFEDPESSSRLDHFRTYAFFDVVGVDCYPLKPPPGPNPADAPLTALAKWVDDAYEAIRLEGEDATVHMVLETFQFGGWRMPPPEQLKLMVYLSSIHGAKGIWYFCYGGSTRDGQHYGPGPGIHDFPLMWEYVGKLNQELQSLGKVFLSLPILSTMTVSTSTLATPNIYGYAPIHYTLKWYEDCYYLITANGSENQGYTAAFNLPFAEEVRQIEVLFEDRIISPTADGFADHYDPMEVHVYKLTVDKGAGVFNAP